LKKNIVDDIKSLTMSLSLSISKVILFFINNNIDPENVIREEDLLNKNASNIDLLSTS
jgi:hypothetical protein